MWTNIKNLIHNIQYLCLADENNNKTMNRNNYDIALILGTL